MITLKLSQYSEDEVRDLVILMENALYHVQHYGVSQCGDCKICPKRHVCLDLHYATAYARDYKPSN